MLNPKQDDIQRLLALLEAAADSIEHMSDDEIRVELEALRQRIDNNPD
jgi:hypothetical protein